MLDYLLPSAWILDEVKDSHLKILKETERISIAKKTIKKYQLETQRLYAKILLIFNLFYTLSF